MGMVKQNALLKHKKQMKIAHSSSDIVENGIFVFMLLMFQKRILHNHTL